jgi:hypothetical protein
VSKQKRGFDKLTHRFCLLIYCFCLLNYHFYLFTYSCAKFGVLSKLERDKKRIALQFLHNRTLFGADTKQGTTTPNKAQQK